MKKVKLFLLCLAAIIPMALSAQNVQVKGTIKDANTEEPIPYASVLIKDTLIGTVSDADGKYSISAPAGSTLVFSSVGYVTVAQAIGSSNVMDVFLKQDAEYLDEVMVVAYGTASRAAFTGSAVQVKGEDIAKVSSESLDKGMVGRISGVRIASDNGDPGSAATIQIRGIGSVSGSTQPLYVIDGIVIDPASNGDINTGQKSTAFLNTINPEDVESMTILKDAAAASLYGSRAANGVVIITTKRGKAGKTKVNYTGEVGFTQLANMKAFKLMDAPTFRQWIVDSFDAYFNAYYGTPLGTVTGDNLATMIGGDVWDPTCATTTDWAKEVFRTAPTTNHQISLSGGNDRTQVYAGLGYTNNKGVIIGSGFDRFSGRLNVDHKVNSWLKASFRQMLSFTNTKGYLDQSDQKQGWGNATPTSSIFQQDPSAPVKDENGAWLDGTSWSGGVDNPHLAFEEDSYEYYKTSTTRSLSNIDLTVTFAPWLYLTNQFGYDWSDSRQYMWWGPDSADGGSFNGLKNEYDFQTKTLTNSTVLHFDNSFGKHNINAILGYEYADHYSDVISAATSNFAVNTLTALSAGQTYSVGGSSSRSVMNSILASANYNYADKYYVSASFRRDGSSRLGKNNRWANFWSVSGAWRISNEDFMGGNPLFTDLKIKASYGTNGNLPGGYYSYGKYYAVGAAYAGKPAIYGSSTGNDDLGWEKSKNFNVGFEWNMYNRVNLSVEYYNKLTSALLFPRPISIVTGFSSYTANVGSLSNYGIELEVSSKNIQRKNFSWTTDFNFTWQKNKILELPDHEDISAGDGGLYRLSEGHSLYSFYLPVMKGVNRETGLAEFWVDPEDESQGVTNFYSQAGYTFLGKGIPDVIGGMTNTFKLYNFDLSFLISYQFGASLFDYMEYFTVSDGMRAGGFNQLAKAADYWTPDNPDAKYPRVIYGNPYRSDRWSSRHIKSTDNIRVREITLGYTQPFKKVIESARIYLKATNPFMIWSATPDVDPDVPINGYRTVDVPATRSFIVGVSITF